MQNRRIVFYRIVLKKKFNKDNTGLYKGDRLGCFKTNSGHQNDKIREELINKLNAI